ncbi:hypothetical protein OHB12_20730 [Nocardia sp. NBC_01730]|uniref:hypothetical protein n=1 Tax=Nocardia sp. NBC_01730 TaxID=2975998 RepID=UPI002E15EDBE|nr:hypothetical protein OHB12_20730 [Nocardia sp. NBC_01730]
MKRATTTGLRIIAIVALTATRSLGVGPGSCRAGLGRLSRWELGECLHEGDVGTDRGESADYDGVGGECADTPSSTMSENSPRSAATPAACSGVHPQTARDQPGMGRSGRPASLSRVT